MSRKWLIDALAWVLAGALVGFGLVGFLTGLLLVPFGVLFAVWLASDATRGSGFFLVGIGTGPVVLLFDDLGGEVSGAVPMFWIGVGLMVLGLAVAAIQYSTSLRRASSPTA